MDHPPLPALAAAALLLVAGCGSRPADDNVLGDTEEAPVASEVGPLAVYRNERVPFAVGYPSTLLSPLWPQPGEASRGFLAMNEEAALRAYGRPIGRGQHLAALRHRVAASYDVVAYEAALDSAFVLSGFRDDRIAYTKVVRRGATLLTLELEYDRDRRALYDRVVEAVAPSFPDGPPSATAVPLFRGADVPPR
jgi:hypothetical protein